MTGYDGGDWNTAPSGSGGTDRIEAAAGVIKDLFGAACPNMRVSQGLEFVPCGTCGDCIRSWMPEAVAILAAADAVDGRDAEIAELRAENAQLFRRLSNQERVNVQSRRSLFVQRDYYQAENERLQSKLDEDPTRICHKCGTATWPLDFDTDAKRAMVERDRAWSLLDPDNEDAVATVAKLGHDAFFADEGSGLMGRALWDSFGQRLLAALRAELNKETA